MIDREWELFSYAIDETAVALRISEADAFDQLKAWIVDGKVQAKGHWPDGPGVASSTDPVCVLPAEEFRFADRHHNRLAFLQAMKTVDGVEINIVQLRAVLYPETEPVGACPTVEAAKPPDIRPGPKPGLHQSTKANVATAFEQLIADGTIDPSQHGACAEAARILASRPEFNGCLPGTIEKYIRGEMNAAQSGRISGK